MEDDILRDISFAKTFIDQNISLAKNNTDHYIILDNGILKSNSSIFPRSERPKKTAPNGAD